MIEHLLLQATPDRFENASSGIANGFNSTGPLVLIVGAVLALVVGILASQRIYYTVLKGTSRFAQSVEYALKGVATLFVVGLLSLPIYVLATIDGQTRLLAGVVLVGCVVAYLGLVLMGYLGEKVWIRLNEQHENVTGESLTDRLATDSDGENA
jgi:hypothetical protein